MQNLVEQKQQRHGAARQRPRSFGCGGSPRRSANGRPAASLRCAASRRARAATAAAARRRTGAPASAITTLTPTDRSSVLFPDMFEPLTMSTRGPPPPRRTSLLDGDRIAAQSAGGRARRVVRAGPSSTSSGNGSSGRSNAKVPSAESASSSPTARSHSRDRRARSAVVPSIDRDRQLRPHAAGCTRSARTSGCASSRATIRGVAAVRCGCDGGTPAVTNVCCSATSRGELKGSRLDPSRAAPASSPRSRSGVSMRVKHVTDAAAARSSQPRSRPAARRTAIPARRGPRYTAHRQRDHHQRATPPAAQRCHVGEADRRRRGPRGERSGPSNRRLRGQHGDVFLEVESAAAARRPPPDARRTSSSGAGRAEPVGQRRLADFGARRVQQFEQANRDRRDRDRPHTGGPSRNTAPSRPRAGPAAGEPIEPAKIDDARRHCARSKRLQPPRMDDRERAECDPGDRAATPPR